MKKRIVTHAIQLNFLAYKCSDLSDSKCSGVIIGIQDWVINPANRA